MDLLGPWHLLIVAAVFVMLFGAKRLPDAARSLGKSARILKSEIKEMHNDPEPAPVAKVVDAPVILTAPQDEARGHIVRP